MMEDDQIVCPRCEKVIRHERPLFCPYCGAKLEPVDGLTDGSNDMKMYPWAGIAPFLIRLLGLSLLALLPVAWVFGRTGVTILVVIFCIAVTGITVVALFVKPRSKK